MSIIDEHWTFYSNLYSLFLNLSDSNKPCRIGVSYIKTVLTAYIKKFLKITILVVFFNVNRLLCCEYRVQYLVFLQSRSGLDLQ